MMKKKQKIAPVKAWASVWIEGNREAICGVGFYRENLQQNLRHIRVLITPVVRKKRKASQ